MQKKYIEKLKKGGLKVVESLKEQELSNVLLNRYKNIPSEYLTFLSSFERITNSTDTIWFNSNTDFSGTSDSEFKWNEIELLSIVWSEKDHTELEKISEFWDNHIPILISVKNGYQFLAICLLNKNHGEIVQGGEPEFEEVEKVCQNLDELINLIENRKLESLI